MQYCSDRKGTQLSILGYGCLRFTKENGKIDIQKTEAEIVDQWIREKQARGQIGSIRGTGGPAVQIYDVCGKASADLAVMTDV